MDALPSVAFIPTPMPVCVRVGASVSPAVVEAEGSPSCKRKDDRDAEEDVDDLCVSAAPCFSLPPPHPPSAIGGKVGDAADSAGDDANELECGGRCERVCALVRASAVACACMSNDACVCA